MVYCLLMVTRGRHPKKAVATALDGLDGDRFRVEEIHRGHRWGVVRCLWCGATLAVWSTPRVPEDLARAIGRFVARHKHGGEQA